MTIQRNGKKKKGKPETGTNGKNRKIREMEEQIGEGTQRNRAMGKIKSGWPGTHTNGQRRNSSGNETRSGQIHKGPLVGSME